MAFIIAFGFMGTGCKKEDKSMTAISEPEASAEEADVENTERQIVEAVCMEIYGKSESDHVDYLINTAGNLSQQVLGNIISEEDTIEKARTIWSDILGSEFIQNIESDFIEVNGEKIKYERINPSYNVKFFDKYDAWLIMPYLPSGIREDGIKFSTPGMAPYFIIRGRDGKIIGALI